MFKTPFVRRVEGNEKSENWKFFCFCFEKMDLLRFFFNIHVKNNKINSIERFVLFVNEKTLITYTEFKKKKKPNFQFLNIFSGGGGHGTKCSFWEFLIIHNSFYYTFPVEPAIFISTKQRKILQPKRASARAAPNALVSFGVRSKCGIRFRRLQEVQR